MKTKLVFLLVGIMLVAVFFTGCTPAEQPTDVEEPEADGATESIETVKIGAILPLTGSAAATGVKLQAAMEVAQEIINGEYPDIAIPLAKEAGLPNLGNAKLEIVFADHQGNPEMAKSEAERLIDEGWWDWLDATTARQPASQAAEQYGIPFVAGLRHRRLTERRLNYFVRLLPMMISRRRCFRLPISE